MTVQQIFQPVEAMKMRHTLGTWLDKVVLTNRRYVIQRRGRAKALLVPLSDGDIITAAIQDKQANVDAVYAAFERARGIINDPHMRDASETIDAHLYGARQSTQVQEQSA